MTTSWTSPCKARRKCFNFPWHNPWTKKNPSIFGKIMLLNEIFKRFHCCLDLRVRKYIKFPVLLKTSQKNCRLEENEIFNPFSLDRSKSWQPLKKSHLRELSGGQRLTSQPTTSQPSTGMQSATGPLPLSMTSICGSREGSPGEKLRQ